MSEAGASAGALLRQARVARGLDIGALAADLKVSERKLELLEQDRHDELHDATFVRALAHSVCRHLGIDAGPVVALLPQAQGVGLDQINHGLNAPFRDRPGAIVAGRDWSVLARPIVWAPALIVLAAILLYFWPASDNASRTVARAPAPAASAASAPASAPTTVVETVYSAPPPEVAPAGAAPAAPTVNGMLQLRTTAQSWVEVLDARGQMLLSRVIQPGETIGLDGPLPLRVKIGNSAGTQLTFRGEVVELTPYSRENVAKLELK